MQEYIGVDREEDNGRRRRNMIVLQFGPVESTFLLVLLKLCCYHVLLMGKKFVLGYICITICVHVSIKAGGLGCTGWGGGFKSTKGQYPPCNVWIFLCEGRCFFCFFYIAIKRSFEVGDICVCTTVIITNKVCLNWIELNQMERNERNPIEY